MVNKRLKIERHWELRRAALKTGEQGLLIGDYVAYTEFLLREKKQQRAGRCEARPEPPRAMASEASGAEAVLQASGQRLAASPYARPAPHDRTGENQQQDRQYLELVRDIAQRRVDVNARDSLNRTAVHLSVGYGHQEMLEHLLRGGAAADALDLHGRTALHLAASLGDLASSSLLLSYGADPCAHTYDGFSPLFYAVRAGSTRLVELLVARGCDVNELVNDRELNRQYSYLHCAVERNHVLMVETLLGCKADVNERDCYGSTALHLASRDGRSEIAVLLLQQGARVHERDYNDLTALYLAVEGGHKELFHLLVRHGADPRDRGAGGASLLHLAVKRGDLEFVELLLSLGVDVDAATRFGKTPLHYAIAEKNWTLLGLLLERGADVNRREALGKTPLHSAVESRRQEAFEILLSHGADANARDNQYQTPLHAAVKQGCPGSVQTLLRYGADVNAEDERRQTPLHLAVRSACVHLFELLRRSQADINASDVDGNTPLHLAVAAEHSKLLYVLPDFTFFASLLDSGADIYKRTISGGETALHLAVRMRCAVFARKLLLRGADVHIEEESAGRRPLHVAVDNEDAECVEQLLIFGADIRARDGSGRAPLEARTLDARVARAFARHFARLSAAGCRLEPDLERAIHHFGEADFLERCAEEVRQLRAARLSPDATYFDLLRAGRRALVTLVHRPEVRRAFETQNQSFPIYAPMLERNFARGLRYEPYLERATEALTVLLGDRLPSLPLDRILGFLDHRDMANLAETLPPTATVATAAPTS